MSRLTPDVYGRWPVLEALRAGHVERVYVARESRAAPVLREIHEAARLANVPVQAVPRAELGYDQLDADRPLVIVVGGEGKGLTRLVREHCDQTIRVPMRGHVSALNAAVAGAVVLFEVRRQRDAAAGRQTS